MNGESDLAELILEAYIKRLVASAPPLSEEQRLEIGASLRTKKAR